MKTRMPRLRRAWGALVVLLLANAACAADTPALVAAASDLRFAMDEIAAQFRRDGGRAVTVSYGSSGNYFRQIQQGAPYQLFMSADERFVLRLHEAGRTEGRGVLYAVGRIVLFAPRGASWAPDANMTGLRGALAAGTVRRFAIANPEHAPYGRAAQQALQALGLWGALEQRLVLGENVSQAAQFASEGSAAGGIFAYSLALSPAIAARGTYVVLPEALHEPLRQRMALVKGAGAAARELYRYLQGPAARAIFERHGFGRPAGG